MFGMGSPQLNFLAAIAIGLVIGVVGAITLREDNARAVWLAPVLALAGSLAASTLALVFGDVGQYGWKEPILQVVLAVAGLVAVHFIGAARRPGTG
jgi:NhaP-type Na+/H+ or K+/H+ antiporter